MNRIKICCFNNNKKLIDKTHVCINIPELTGASCFRIAIGLGDSESPHVLRSHRVAVLSLEDVTSKFSDAGQNSAC